MTKGTTDSVAAGRGSIEFTLKMKAAGHEGVLERRFEV